MYAELRQTVWRIWDRLYRRAAGLQPLADDGSYLFYITQHRYLGKPFTVDDVQVRRFEPVIELHMNNDLLFDILRDTRSVVGIAVRLMREANRAFPALAKRLVQDDGEFNHIHVLLGTTFIHRGVAKLGFSSFPIRNPLFRSLITWHLKWVFKSVNPQSHALFQSNPDAFVPKVVAITKENLILQFANQTERTHP